MRVFIGLAEVADQTYTYAKGFQALGHETYTVIIERNPFYPDSVYDEVVAERTEFNEKGGRFWERAVHRMEKGGRRLVVFIKALRRCDAFIFLSATSFLPGFWDYPIIKLFGKRLIAVFLGDDVRYWFAYEQEMRLLGLEKELKPYLDYRRRAPNDFYRIKRRRIRWAERYADLILSQPSQGELQTRPYMRINIPLDLSLYRSAIPGRQIPLVVHAPSDRSVKGTEYVLAAVERLKTEGVAFEFKLIEKMPNTQVREWLTEADIVIDQLFSQTVARLALEALATGNVVLARLDPEFAQVPPGCPVVNVTRDTLPSELRRVILDRDLRQELAQKGRVYVEKYHNHTGVTQQILDWLQPGGIPTFDFVPRFFHNHFAMPPELLDEERRKMRKERIDRWSHLFCPRGGEV